MPRYAALLRGVMPTNAKMPALREAFEAAGFSEVRTVLGSGNVVFDTRRADEAKLAAKAEKAMTKHLGRTFLTLVRSLETLETLLASDPFAGVRLPREARRVVTFLRKPPVAPPELPLAVVGACIHRVIGTEAYTSYVRTPKGPVFMQLIERTFGKESTTRTWETVTKLVKA